MTQSGRAILCWTCLFLVSCGPSTLDDLRYFGEAQTKKLAEELRKIETKEDLQKAAPLLKKRFNKLAELLQKARSFPNSHLEPSVASEELFAEMARLYEIPGCRELIEGAQAEAVHRLR